jgi:integrase
MKLPRGIQAVEYIKTDKTISVKYRVRITRKSFKGKSNNYFDNLDEAKSFLALSKLEKGKELIYSIAEEQRIEERLKQTEKETERENRLNNKNYTFQYFAQIYLKNYVFNKPATTELIKRNQAVKKCFINRICKTSIPDQYLTQEEKEDMNIEHEEDIWRYFGGLDIRTEIDDIDIDNYIKERLKTIKPVSVVRELTYITNVYNKLRHIDRSLKGIQNPVKSYDKTLLQNVINIRKRILSEEEEIKFLEVINNYSNKQLADICKLSLLTSMRKSEVVFLKQSDIKEDCKYITLLIPKSKKTRDVYLDKTARQFLMQLKPAEKAKDDRFFTYSNAGFSKVFSELMIKNNMQSIHFHDLRRTKISRMLSLGGSDNTILIAKILGFQSAIKFKEIHSNNQNSDLSSQAGMLATHGHSNVDISFKHYFNPVFTEIDKMQRVDILKSKRKTDTLSSEEEKELLDLMLELQDR